MSQLCLFCAMLILLNNRVMPTKACISHQLYGTAPDMHLLNRIQDHVGILSRSETGPWPAKNRDTVCTLETFCHPWLVAICTLGYVT